MKYLLFCLIFFNINLLGQIKLKDLQGEWKCDNTDSLYYKSDTIKFYQAQLYNQTVFNNKMNKILGCGRISWVIKRNKLKVYVENGCIEPPTTTSYIKPWQIKLISKNGYQHIQVKHITGLAYLFEVIKLDKIEIIKKEKEFEKTLILKRIREIKNYKIFIFNALCQNSQRNTRPPTSKTNGTAIGKNRAIFTTNPMTVNLLASSFRHPM